MQKENGKALHAGSLKTIRQTKKRKRPDILADLLRDRILTEGLEEGARIPSEWVARLLKSLRFRAFW
jgi:DNA-binding GntR family transcriptional regulator